MTQPLFPQIIVNLTDEVDGNAFAVVGHVKEALRQNGVKPEDQREFIKEALSGDYDHMIQTVMTTVEVT